MTDSWEGDGRAGTGAAADRCDPEREAKLDRIGQVTSTYPDRFAFDQCRRLEPGQ